MQDRGHCRQVVQLMVSEQLHVVTSRCGTLMQIGSGTLIRVEFYMVRDIRVRDREKHDGETSPHLTALSDYPLLPG